MKTSKNQGFKPLADRMRPTSLDEILGQDHLLGPGKPISSLLKSNHLPSMVFWGPPGSGKTTLARLLSGDRPFYQISAVLSGVPQLRSMISEIQKREGSAVLFVDEIHRWNKAQQDALLPYVEDGTLILIGATTENPSFEIISPLLSRTRLFLLRPLTVDHMRTLLQRSIADKERGIGHRPIKIEADALEALCHLANGDARQALNTLEMVIHITEHVTVEALKEALEKKTLLYDKAGEQHYDTISAFIKSMRGSDPDAALYYLAKMYEAGEDPRFIARRMIIFASEDIGNADPRALQLAVSAAEAFDRVGIAEGLIPLSQAVVYLACAPKSNASYSAYSKAKKDLLAFGDLPVPMHLRNSPTKLMKHLGYGKGYEYAHGQEGAVVSHHHLPDKLKGRRYYNPGDRGLEIKFKERLEWLKRQRT